MFWPDSIAADARQKGRRDKPQVCMGEPFIVRDEKTISGRPHVGSLRSFAISGILHEVLVESGCNAQFLYEINDTDAFDSVPVFLEAAQFTEHLGKPLYLVPSPDGGDDSFADYFAAEYTTDLRCLGFEVEFYRSSEKYRSGAMNPFILTALENAGMIRDIDRRISKNNRPESWLPVQMLCEQCNKIATTQALVFDGREVRYRCNTEEAHGATGCGFQGKRSPFDGNATLFWKVEWAAKFALYGVDLEVAGKDHYTKGGSRHVANAIAEEVLGVEHPYDVPHEFFIVGGKKMSSSKGAGATGHEMVRLLPPSIFRFMVFAKGTKRAIEFNAEGDTIPRLFDEYDKLRAHYAETKDDDYARLFELAHPPSERNDLRERFSVRFSQVAYLVQMPHIDMHEEATRMKGSELTQIEADDLYERAEYARRWIKTYAPEKFVFEVQKELPQAAHDLTIVEREALGNVRTYLEANPNISGDVAHTALHEIRKESDLEPAAFFSALYRVFLGKDHGPKAGWFLSVLDREFVLGRLGEASAMV